MKRYFFEISYDGTDYFGWQIQPKQLSVQALVQSCLSRLHSNKKIEIVGCGRTDTGVHAHHYVFHVDVPEIESCEQLLFKLNRMLPESISVQRIYPVPSDLHARFDAKWRTYRYFVHTKKNPFKSRFSTYFPQPLNFELMNEAAQLLIGTHDFTTLSKAHTDVKTHICEVSRARWEATSDEDYYFEITANRFLRNMVRATVGTLFDVGTAKLSPVEFDERIQAKDRSLASGSAAPNGLFLWDISYDIEEGVANDE